MTNSHCPFGGAPHNHGTLVYNSSALIKTTAYFREQVLRKRPYIQADWCERILLRPLAKAVQVDGRIRFWGIVPELGGRIPRVVTLADGETVHNAFPDRNFKMPVP